MKQKILPLLFAIMASIGLSQAAVIEVDGNFADWDAVPTYRLSQAFAYENALEPELYAIKFYSESDAVYFYFEYNGGVYAYLDDNNSPAVGNIVNAFGIYMNIDGDASTGYLSNWWANNGTDYLLEGGAVGQWWSNIEYFPENAENRNVWQFADSGIGGVVTSCDVVTLGNGHKAIEGKIDLAMFPREIFHLKLGVIANNSQWVVTGCLPQRNMSENEYFPSPLLEIRMSNAENVCVQQGDLYYNLNPMTLTAEVTYQEQSGNNYAGLTSAVIPSTVTYNAQSYTVTTIGSQAFKTCGTLQSVSIPNTVTDIRDLAFDNCSALASVNIPESVIRIGYSAFNWCLSLTELVLPNSVKIIEANAFSGCAFQSFTLPDNITEFGGWVFYGCRNLKEIVIPEYFTCIEGGTFANCASLESITIPSSVANIGAQAFWGCKNLVLIKNEAATPQTFLTNDAFGGNPVKDEIPISKSACMLVVPEESMNLYTTANEWKDFIIRGVGKHQLTYMDKDDALVTSENITLHLPVAPIFEDFTFIKWVVVASDLVDGIKIQAVYEYNGSATAAPSVVVSPTNPAQKLIRNGNVYILTGDKTYTITGAEVK